MWGIGWEETLTFKFVKVKTDSAPKACLLKKTTTKKQQIKQNWTELNCSTEFNWIKLSQTDLCEIRLNAFDIIHNFFLHAIYDMSLYCIWCI